MRRIFRQKTAKRPDPDPDPDRDREQECVAARQPRTGPRGGRGHDFQEPEGESPWLTAKPTDARSPRVTSRGSTTTTPMPSTASWLSTTSNTTRSWKTDVKRTAALS